MTPPTVTMETDFSSDLLNQTWLYFMETQHLAVCKFYHFF